MLPGPVFFHELRTVARRRRSYALRTALGLFLLYLMIQSTNRWDTYAYQSETNREYTPGELALIGMNLFGSVIWLQGIVILLLTPAFVAGTIAEDRQRKVLSYLLASPLSGAEIVLGKLAARMVNLVVLVAVGLPVVSIALFLGGIDPADVWLWYGSSFSTLYLLAGVSIFVSTFSPRPRDAILRTYLIELVWLLLPLVEWLCGSAGGTLGRLTSEARPITEWVIGSSPIVLLCQSSVWLSGSGSGVVQAVTWLIGLQLLQGTLLLAWSTMRLRPVEQGSRLRGLRWLGSRRVSQPRRLFAPALRRCPHDLERVQRNGFQPESHENGLPGLPDRGRRGWHGILGVSHGHPRIPGGSGLRLWVNGNPSRPRRPECWREISDGMSLRAHGTAAGSWGRDRNHDGTREGCLDQLDRDAAGGPRNPHREDPGSLVASSRHSGRSCFSSGSSA